VDFYCDIDYDVFQMMKDNDFKYGMCFDCIQNRSLTMSQAGRWL
jgi:hypothetical protein